MPLARTPAKVHNIEFKYSKPLVSVDTGSNEVEHETIDDEIVVQVLGRSADRIRIEGLVIGSKVGKIDNLVKEGEITVRTERWSGTAVCTSTSTNFAGGYDLDDDWLHDYTIDLVEVDEVEIATGGPAGFGGFEAEEFALGVGEETTPVPEIDNFSLIPVFQGSLNVSFESDTELTDILVRVTGPDTTELTRSDFDQNIRTGIYAYDATFTPDNTGDFTATLLEAIDRNGNDGVEGGGDPVSRATVS